ncbi:hypothetical protein IC575_023029 [Cucumis melo]
MWKKFVSLPVYLSLFIYFFPLFNTLNFIYKFFLPPLNLLKLIPTNKFLIR